MPRQFLYNQLQAIALAVAGPSFGKLIIVMPSTDPNYDRLNDLVNDVDNEGEVRVFNTIEAAYAAATTNRNDVILMSAYGTHEVEAGMAWSKNRIHVVGMDGGDRMVQQGTKIQTASDAEEVYVIAVTGNRNSFRNIKFIQASTEATALTVAKFGGEGTLVKNCSFVFGVADNLSETNAHEVIMGEDSGTFINCTFGSDTLTTSGARAVMLIDPVTSGQEMKSCVFIDCLWSIQSSSSSADFIRVNDTDSCKFTQTFINPVFNCSLVSSASAVKLDDAVRSVSGLVEGNLLFVNPSSNTTEFCTDVTDQVVVVGPAVSAQAGEGIVPS